MRLQPWRFHLASRRGAAALEFAFCALPFLAMLLAVFEISFDLFTQAALDVSLQTATREVQTGNAQNAKNGVDFITKYLCPAAHGLLTCSNIYVKVQHLSLSQTQDYYNFTTGVLPMSNGSLDLSGYGSANFCNSGPAELLLVSAIYVGPTVLGTLIPNLLAVRLNGALVHATLSTVGVVAENYAAAAAATGAAAPC